nr:radical SAM protein [Oscillatoria laete-virens]
MRSRKLLLLAFSGVRVRNEELLKLGLTLPGFVDRSRVIASLPSLGLLTIASFTPPHWEIIYREIDKINNDTVSDIVGLSPDLIAVSSLTARIQAAYSVCDQLRKCGITVVMGGLHASVMPEEALGHADAIVRGEGEPVWADVMRDFEAGKLQSSYPVEKSDVSGFDFSQARIPRYDLLDITAYNRLTLQTTRGCPLNCHFCAASKMISPYKKKSIGQIAAELENILTLWPEAFVELADDNTFIDKKWGKELLSLLGGCKIKWFTETDLSVADDPELLDMLAEAHCAQLLIGLEAAGPEGLKNIDAANWKYKRFERHQEAIKAIQDRGISVNGCFIIGHDTDDESVFDRTIQYVDALELSEVQLTLLTPFPGTALHNNLLRQKRLFKNEFWDQCTLFDLTYEPKQMSADTLREGFKYLMSEIYSPRRVQKRKTKFRECIRKRYQA